MAQFKEIFPKDHTLLVVIHVEDEQQMMRNLNIAFGEGADGVFLINHNLRASELLRCYYQARDAFKEKWIGLNFLDRSPKLALDMFPHDANGLWADNGGIIQTAKFESVEDARNVKEYRKAFAPQGLYFGGVAFKHQQQVFDSGKAAALARPYMDVITTSGVTTGQSPSVEKIRAMRHQIEDHPLAIASGITPENVHYFFGLANVFMVATGISDSHTELNPTLVRKLARILE